ARSCCVSEFIWNRAIWHQAQSIRLAAVRRLAYEAADAGLLSPELAAGIRRVTGVKKLGGHRGPCRQGWSRSNGFAPKEKRQLPGLPAGCARFTLQLNQGAGTTTLFAGTICGWIENTSRLDGSTSTLTQCTLLRSLRSGCAASLDITLSPKVSIRVKFSRRRRPVFTASGGSLS